ncbi:hypothetical protein WJT74_01285 [Sphingomicrobium sp. XHP0239]|uniref:hypothetical protein n=1 Tax=Sphingomicrobium maritimum TaxID=3133972 RepID=UPI0031CC796A
MSDGGINTAMRSFGVVPGGKIRIFQAGDDCEPWLEFLGDERAQEEYRIFPPYQYEISQELATRYSSQPSDRASFPIAQRFKRGQNLQDPKIPL